jgi:hypothetical protein
VISKQEEFTVNKTLQIRSLIAMIIIAFILPLIFVVNVQATQLSSPQSTTGWYINNDSIGGRKISMVSATDGWIIDFGGSSAYLYHWDGISWSSHGSILHGQSIVRGDISMISATDGWIGLGGPLGGDAYSSIYHWDGISWALFDVITDPNEVSFSSIDMITATDGWAAAGFKFGSKYYHWDGVSWELHTNIWLPLVADDDIDMISADDGWAVGFTGKITHWDGNTWSQVTSPVTTSLNSISMVSPTDGWIVGNAGVILHWNGTNWSLETSPVSTDLYSISMVSSTDGWAVGDSGVILQWDGILWTQVDSPTTEQLNAVTMLSATDGWIVGWGGILRYQMITSLTINYLTGAPSSYFTITGTDFPVNDTATITINGQEIGSVSTDADGGFVFLLSTLAADEGVYYVTASVNPSANIRFVLDSDEPVRPLEGTGTIFEVPAAIAFPMPILLPIVFR